MRLAVLAAAAVAAACCAGQMQTGGALMAVAALGRAPPDPDAGGAPAPRGGRQVGVFYFLWCGAHGTKGPYDVTKILAADPEAGRRPNSPVWGGHGVYHHWGEPFYGYYFSNDEWVVRRHMRLLMQAGVDFLFFDTTNGVIYENTAKMVMRVLQEHHDAGWKVPKVMFYTNTASGRTVQRLYDAIYRPCHCRDVWFMFEGRPLIVAKREECSVEARAFFSFRASQWPNERAKADGWPWMDFTRPQRVFRNSRGEPEAMNVSVAQHPQLRFGDSAMYGERGNRGRAFHDGANDPSPGAWLRGGNFAEQFERALEADPPVVLVTGWNEWIMGRWKGRPDRPIMFVDCANAEYSRDLEMMRGGYFDNYFMQLVGYVRRYKGADGHVARAEGDPPAIYDNVADGDFPRHAQGYGRVYENRTQRCAIRRVEVRHDADDVHFRIRTKRPIDPGDRGGTWLRLYLNVDGGRGYGFVANNTPSADGSTTLARVKERGERLDCDDIQGVRVACRMSGDALTLSVPRSALGVAGRPFTLWFKAADSRSAVSSVEDFYDQGDAAPLGRLNYVYRAR